MRTRVALCVLIGLVGCGPVGTDNGGSGGSTGSGGSGGSPNLGSGGSGRAGGSTGSGGSGGGGQQGCGELQACYTVYAHSDTILYHVDLVMKQLVEVGPFNAPMVPSSNGMMAQDVITDLAVSPDDKIYVISKTNLYTASSTDGHVTLVGPVTACGTYAVALTFTHDGQLYAGDFSGAFCKIDLTQTPPRVIPVAQLGQGLALAGDIVAVQDGTMFGTAYRTADPSNAGTQTNNLLVKIDPATGLVTQVMGMTGFPKLFGVAFDQGKVFGFTHDGSGNVVTIDPATGAGTMYATFTDPSTGRGISFAGAGVSPNVPIVGISANQEE